MLCLKLFGQSVLIALTMIVLISLSHFLVLLAMTGTIVALPWLIYRWRKICNLSSRDFAS